MRSTNDPATTERPREPRAFGLPALGLPALGLRGLGVRGFGLLAALSLAACGSPQAGAPAAPPVESEAPSGSAATTGETSGSGEARGASAAAPAPGGECRRLVSELSLEDQVGQLMMLGKPATSPVDASYRQVLKETRTGQVLLLENTSAGRAGVRQLTDDLRDAAVDPGVRLLVAADQEGGLVQRLKGPGFDTIPSATQQAEMSDAELTAGATIWGRQLKQAGVDVDLAPVADVVPDSVGAANEPIGKLRRGYGSDTGQVADKTAAFVTGMKAAGVATSVKHFPNLGRVRGNTDLEAGVTDRQTGRDDETLKPFRAGIEAGSEMVMVSTAIYAEIDPDSPAAFSRTVVNDMIRDDLGFDGVIISDDLGAAKQVADVAPGDRAVRFLEAGGDVVINGSPAIHRQFYQAVLDRARTDDAFAQELETKVARVLAVKAGQGAVECTP